MPRIPVAGGGTGHVPVGAPPPLAPVLPPTLAPVLPPTLAPVLPPPVAPVLPPPVAPVLPPPVAPVLPPPGWYRDPGGIHEYRFWGGSGWTPGVASGSVVTQDRPPRGSLDPRQAADVPDARAKLPKAAGLVALVGILCAVLLSAVGATGASLAAPHNSLATLLLSQAGLWAGLVGSVWFASRRYGSGNVWRDFGVLAKGPDVGRGLLVSIVARLLGGALIVPLIRVSTRFSGTDLKPLQVARHDPTMLGVLVAMALVGAPLIEELFFRGLLLRSLIPALGTVGAIAGQAVVFASLHLRPSYGLGNASIFVAIAAMGAVQGWVAERYRRLGPGIFAHSFFNLVAVLFLALR